MSKLIFIEVKNEPMVDILIRLADKIWKEYYYPILGEHSTRYILENIHNKKNLLKHMEEGCKYFLLQQDDMHIGYLGFLQKSLDDAASFHPKKPKEKSRIYIDDMATSGHSVALHMGTEIKANHDSLYLSYLSPLDLYLKRLYVIKSYRGIGIGGQALNFMRYYTGSNTAIWLKINVLNKESIKAYEAMKFSTYTSLKVDLGHGYINVYLLMRQLYEDSKNYIKNRDQK